MILSPLLVGTLWLVVSFLSSLSAGGLIDPELLLVIKGFANRSLWILALLSIIAMIIGIVLLATNKNTKITTKEVIKYGWENSKKHVKKFLLWFWIIVALSVLNGIFNPQDVEVQSVLSIVLWFIVNVLNTWIMLWLARIALDIVYDREYKISNLFVGFDKTIKYIGAYILTMIITIIGFFLLIFPGIIRAIKLSLAQYLILDKWYNPIKAIKISRKMTKGYVGDIFIISFVAWLINILWVLALLVWLIWTLPLSIIANAYIYKKISDKNKALID